MSTSRCMHPICIPRAWVEKCPGSVRWSLTLRTSGVIESCYVVNRAGCEKTRGSGLSCVSDRRGIKSSGAFEDVPRGECYGVGWQLHGLITLGAWNVLELCALDFDFAGVGTEIARFVERLRGASVVVLSC